MDHDHQPRHQGFVDPRTCRRVAQAGASEVDVLVVSSREQSGGCLDLLTVSRFRQRSRRLQPRRERQVGVGDGPGSRCTAETVNAAAIKAFASLPPHLKRTLTWDQGTEMARHRDLATTTGVEIYFAERCSPWQRGANENYDGLLRQYFPKGIDLSVHSETHVAAVMHELNNRPRKGLDYDTPAARLRAESRRPDPRNVPTDTLRSTTSSAPRCVDR